MAVVVEKKITVDGEDYQLLSDICELARRRIANEIKSKPRHTITDPDCCYLDEYSLRQVQQIEQFLERVWQ